MLLAAVFSVFLAYHEAAMYAIWCGDGVLHLASLAWSIRPKADYKNVSLRKVDGKWVFLSCFHQFF
jgi:hypothetical protein